MYKTNFIYACADQSTQRPTFNLCTLTPPTCSKGRGGQADEVHDGGAGRQEGAGAAVLDGEGLGGGQVILGKATTADVPGLAVCVCVCVYGGGGRGRGGGGRRREGVMSSNYLVFAKVVGSDLVIVTRFVQTQHFPHF